MKASCLLKVAMIISFLSQPGALFSQGTSWEKARNCGCYFQTNARAVFTWSGSVSEGYCNGYGTIQWYEDGSESSKFVGTLKRGKAEGYATQYYPNGKILYQGYWKNDMRHGYGSSYYSSGNIRYKGYFENDEFANLYSLQLEARSLTDTIVKKIFFGGRNVKYKINRAIYDSDNNLREIWVHISFNGNIDATNEYYLTFKYNEDWLIKADFFDYSDNCEDYLILFTASSLINLFRTGQ